MADGSRAQLLQHIEAYLDSVPLSAAAPEPVGPFTLFRPTGPWKFYARPTLGLDRQIEALDVDRLRARQVELGLPQNIEWVVQTTPSLAAAARASGMAVHEYPLLVLKRGHVAIDAPPGIEIRQIDGDDRDFAQAHAVATVGFGVPGTAVGSEGAEERDQRAASTLPDVLEFMRDRARRDLSITYAALDGTGPICVGTHQPVNGVSEVVGVATLPSARRRGIAAALTAALVADALDRGVRIVFMGADSDDVARIYERAGFERIGTSAAAEPPE